MNLAVRVSRTFDEIKEWVENITCDNCIVFQHDADEEIARDHVHMLIMGSVCKPDALKARFKKLYGDIEKTDWSFKTANDEWEKYITYMTKGRIPPSYCTFEPIYILNLQEKWVEPSKKSNVLLEDGKLVRNIDESGKKTKRQMLESMRSRYTGTESTREILRIIRKVLIDNNEIIGMYKVLDYYDSLLMYSDKENWMGLMEQKINSRVRI